MSIRAAPPATKSKQGRVDQLIDWRERNLITEEEFQELLVLTVALDRVKKDPKLAEKSRSATGMTVWHTVYHFLLEEESARDAVERILQFLRDFFGL